MTDVEREKGSRVNLTPNQIGWTAGVIDGEGCICAYGQKRSKHSGKVWSLRLIVGNTDIRMIVRLQELWGGRLKSMAKPRDPEKHNQAWQWIVCGPDACRVLKTVRDELVVKGEQADLALQFGELLNTSRSTRKVGEENLRQREELSTQLKLAKGVRREKKVS